MCLSCKYVCAGARAGDCECVCVVCAHLKRHAFLMARWKVELGGGGGRDAETTPTTCLPTAWARSLLARGTKQTHVLLHRRVVIVVVVVVVVGSVRQEEGMLALGDLKDLLAALAAHGSDVSVVLGARFRRRSQARSINHSNGI
jgi:hypothetical protein